MVGGALAKTRANNSGGTLEEPLVYGEVTLHGGSMKLKDAYTVFDNINLDVD